MKGTSEMTVLTEQVRERFAVDDSVVSMFEAEHAAQTIGQRTALWSNEAGRPPRRAEYLLPRIGRPATRETPSFMIEPRDALNRSKATLEAEVRRLAPWTEAFALAHGVNTMPEDQRRRSVAASRIEVRRDLITATVAELLADDLKTTTVLDIGCKCGYFSLDVGARGAMHVDGVDLRDSNVAQASFLAKHYGIDNVDFAVSEAADLDPGEQWDVVLNLGLLYHVTDPVGLLRKTLELCREFAIIDTLCHVEPVSAYMLVGDKDVSVAAEGREPLEFLPTYRAVIDTLRYVGFSEVFEIVGPADIPHATYASGRRRCFLAIK
jgi:hypothetical protein